MIILSVIGIFTILAFALTLASLVWGKPSLGFAVLFLTLIHLLALIPLR